MDALRRDIHIPRAFTALLLWASEILQDFRLPKQALINAFYNYVRKPINRITGAKVVFFCEMSKCLRRKLKDYCNIQGFARMGFGANRQRGMYSVRSEQSAQGHAFVRGFAVTKSGDVP